MINEKKMLNFMKESIKGGGLEVRRLEFNVTDYYIIHAGWWAVVAPAQEIPSKCLALITQVARRLPLLGEAHHMQKTTAEKITDPETIGDVFLEYTTAQTRVNGRIQAYIRTIGTAVKAE